MDEYNRLMEWVRRHWLTVVGIIIILGITWYDLVTVQVQKKEAVDQCNEYWFEAVKEYCPRIANPIGDFEVEGGLFSLNYTSD